MERYTLKNDIRVFGKKVTSFPDGISEAFDELVKTVGGFDRSYYGISFMEGNKMIYYAVAEEREKEEAKKYDCESMVIEKGDYLTVKIEDWRENICLIKDAFGELVNDKRTNKAKPAIEWYKNDKEMLCMVKTTEQKKVTA